MSLFGAMHSVILISSLRIHDILKILSEEHFCYAEETIIKNLHSLVLYNKS